MSSEQKKQQPNGLKPYKTILKRPKSRIVNIIYDLKKDGRSPSSGVGHYIPDSWFQIFVDERGLPYWIAIFVFAEILFRHTPEEKKGFDDDGNLVITLIKCFRGERYQVNRAELAKRFRCSKKAISSALGYLERKLCVIKRIHEDREINCRGFRNMVYVTPRPSRLLKLLASVQPIQAEKVNEFDSNEEILENANKERGTTSPPRENNIASTLKRDHPDVETRRPPRRGDPVPVSRNTSEKPSSSIPRTAEPSGRLEEKMTATTPSAPQAAHDRGDVLSSTECWEAPPPKPSGPNGKFGTPEERVKSIRYRVGQPYKQWYGRFPDCTAEEFENRILEAQKELQWPASTCVAVIQGGWLWAVDAPEKEPDKTFIQGFFSKKCERNLLSLFKLSKYNKLFLWHIQDELVGQTGDAYDVNFENVTREEVELWWKEELLDRGVIRDPDKFYNEKGKVLWNPSETTWVGIRKTLENWLRWNQPGTKPEQKWFDAVLSRFQREPDGSKNIHWEDYDVAKKMLIEQKIAPSDFFASQAGPLSQDASMPSSGRKERIEEI